MVRRSKRKSFVKLSDEVKDTPAASRLRKVLSKDHTNGLGTLLRADGSRTEDQKETLETLMMTHFPESLIVIETDTVQNEEPQIMDSSSAVWKVKWAINSFEPHKSPGLDQIFPALVQRGRKTLLPTLVLMFSTSYALGFLPKA
jgi:hypothetical protein